MRKHLLQELSARERQIMDTLYRRGTATVSEIRERLPDPPTTSAVRTMLLRLEDKGHVKCRRDGSRNVYRPTTSPAQACRSALARLMENFFEGSPARMMASVLERNAEDMDDHELEELMRKIEDARRKGR